MRAELTTRQAEVRVVGALSSKTLGQIAYQVWHGRVGIDEEWPADDRMAVKWEAVAAAVAEECAKRRGAA